MKADPSFVVPYASIQTGAELPPGAPVLVHAELLWAGDLLAVADVRASEELSVRDLGLFASLGGDDLLIARRGASGELALVMPNGDEVPRGSRMTLRLGRTNLRIELAPDDVAPPPRLRLDRRIASSVIGACALHAAVLGAVAYGRGGAGSIEEAARAALEQYMAAAEARAEAEIAKETPVAAGGLAEPAPRERGAAGDPAQTTANRQRATTRGPEPHGDKPRADEIASFGILSLIAGDGANAGTSAFAADLGRGALGNAFGTSIGDAEGFAADALSGIGEGGGGRAAGAPAVLGSSLRGTGATRRALGAARIEGTHRAMTLSCRCGETTVSGRLPPEAVQRVVRANFGRFRACYEDGLSRDPSLEGRVDVRFVIGRDGSVGVASATGTVSDTVHGCIASRFQQLTFPEPEGGIVTVSYPLVLSPS